MHVFWFVVLWWVSGFVGSVVVREFASSPEWPRYRSRITVGGLLACCTAGVVFGFFAFAVGAFAAVIELVGRAGDWIGARLRVQQWLRKEII